MDDLYYIELTIMVHDKTRYLSIKRCIFGSPHAVTDQQPLSPVDYYIAISQINAWNSLPT